MQRHSASVLFEHPEALIDEIRRLARYRAGRIVVPIMCYLFLYLLPGFMLTAALHQ
jgi:hypothetical protein